MAFTMVFWTSYCEFSGGVGGYNMGGNELLITSEEQGLGGRDIRLYVYGGLSQARQDFFFVFIYPKLVDTSLF